MSTISKAVQAEERDQDWTIVGKLVNKLLFTHYGNGSMNYKLTLIIVDSTGETVDVTSWSPEQARYVYHLVSVGSFYQVVGPAEIRAVGKPEFSCSRYEVASCWFIKDADPIHTNSIRSFSRIKNGLRYIVHHESGINLVGAYQKHCKGPFVQSPISKSIVIQGYFVDLLDDTDTRFRVLLWHKLGKSDFALDDCEEGTLVLITVARVNADGKTFTSLFPPIVDPDCISLTRKMQFES